MITLLSAFITVLLFYYCCNNFQRVNHALCKFFVFFILFLFLFFWLHCFFFFVVIIIIIMWVLSTQGFTINFYKCWCGSWVKKKKKKKLFSHEPITENIFISINHIRSSQKLWKRLGKYLYYPCAVVLVSCVWYILSCKWSMGWQQVFVY